MNRTKMFFFLSFSLNWITIICNITNVNERTRKRYFFIFWGGCCCYSTWKKNLLIIIMKGKATHVDSSRPTTRRPRFHAHAEFWDADYTDSGRFIFLNFFFFFFNSVWRRWWSLGRRKGTKDRRKIIFFNISRLQVPSAVTHRKNFFSWFLHNEREA
jgi:hypothetical protein